jgi:uncharacterized membrane protein
MLLSHLVVLAYADEYRAAEVLATLQRLRTGSLVNAQHAVSMVRATDWSVELHYGADLRADAERTGRFWRSLITGLLLVPGGSTDRNSPEASSLDAGFVRRLCGSLPPGSSAVFMIVSRAALRRMLPELERFGGTLLETPVDQSVIARLSGSASPTDQEADRAPGDQPNGRE